MIVLVHGILHQELPDMWWLSRKIDCPACRCKFRLEAKDASEVTELAANGSVHYPRTVLFPCPECGVINALQDIKEESPEWAYCDECGDVKCECSCGKQKRLLTESLQAQIDKVIGEVAK